MPPDSELKFSIGMGEQSPQRSDGVQFEVQASVVNAGPDPCIKIFELQQPTSVAATNRLAATVYRQHRCTEVRRRLWAERQRDHRPRTGAA